MPQYYLYVHEKRMVKANTVCTWDRQETSTISTGTTSVVQSTMVESDTIDDKLG